MPKSQTKDVYVSILNENLNGDPYDETAVILDDGLSNVIEPCRDALEDENFEYEVVEYKVDSHGEDPPEHVAEAMKKHDIFIAPTQHSISHTEARKEACETGSRGVGLPTVTPEILNYWADQDYQEIRQKCQAIGDKIPEVGEVRISTPSGTELSGTVKRDYFNMDDGDFSTPSSYGNVPYGEVHGPALGFNGTMVVDSLPVDGIEAEGLELEIEESQIVEAVYSDNTAEYKKHLGSMIENVDGMRNVAELGLGVVDMPPSGTFGNLLIDEKLGSHIAFGDDTFYLEEGQTECEVHLDTLLQDATIEINGESIMEEGDWKIDH